MDIRGMRMQLGDTQSEFAARYQIPFRTVQNWEAGVRKPPEYMANLLEQRIREDLINRKTRTLPRFDPQKQNLPKRSDFVGATSWLRAVRDCIGQPIVFALDEALMCQGSFGGRSDEYLVWVYGADSVTRFNGIAVLGNQISPLDVQKKNGLAFTNFNRTLSDALANESILDMQASQRRSAGITTPIMIALREFLCLRNTRGNLSDWPRTQWNIMRTKGVIL